MACFRLAIEKNKLLKTTFSRREAILAIYCYHLAHKIQSNKVTHNLLYHLETRLYIYLNKTFII